MATNRRTPSRGSRPRGMAGPGRGPAGRAPVRPPSDAAVRQERPRFTGRAAILVLVLAVLAASYASSFRAYLQQRDHIAALRAQIESTDNAIDRLEREKRRWQDDAYVGQQARLRFGYVKAGENVYQVLDENGDPLDSPDTLSDAGEADADVPEAWWDTAWKSVKAAGALPDEDDGDKPATSIKAPSE
jgi:cell division protein FtsB